MSDRYIFKKKVFEDYTVIINTLIKDKSLTWQARGLLMYLLSKPDNWTVTKTDLANSSPVGGDAVATILKELETAKYVAREKFQNELGRWEWRTYVFDEPYTIPPSTVDGQRGNIVNIDIPSTNTAKKEDLVDAMLKYGKSDPNDIDPLIGYPVDVLGLLGAYIKVSSHRPVSAEKADWIKTARVWIEMRVRSSEVADMYGYAVKNWGVARPGSITKAYRMMKTKQQAEDTVVTDQWRKAE